jgi:hypothetical protein
MRCNVNNKNTYLGWTIVFVASLGAVAVFHYFPVSIVGDLAGVPAIAALFGALFQLSRDRIAFERSVRMEEAKNRFTVGAMSHMADVAFDKHVSFCEEYTTAVYHAMTTLFRRGPHEEALVEAGALADIRIKWDIWLAPEVTTELGKFEGALRKIGANAMLLRDLRADEHRTEAIQEAYGTFAEVMGFETWQGKAVTKERTVEKVVEKLRKVLGVGELTHLRSELVERASQNLK